MLFAFKHSPPIPFYKYTNLPYCAGITSGSRSSSITSDPVLFSLLLLASLYCHRGLDFKFFWNQWQNVIKIIPEWYKKRQISPLLHLGCTTSCSIVSNYLLYHLISYAFSNKSLVQWSLLLLITLTKLPIKPETIGRTIHRMLSIDKN